MNASTANNATDEHIRSRASFMLNASRAVFGICPQLAAYFGNEFLTTCEEDHTEMNILRQMCPYCGVPLVDGRSVQAEARATQRNSVIYKCELCSSKIVFAGASRSGLAQPELDEGPRETVTKLASLSISQEPVAKTQPIVHSMPAAVDQKPAGLDKTHKTDTGPREAARDSKPLDATAEKQAAKRKKHKSKLLAAMAESKKKADAKKAAESSSFSLSDFLTNL
ncbi:hypothetical protein H4R99_005446 [Coemansia sp. RSA 1722]|nr:hypothetical protein H4R99_005446 [Coemansia sp. RSA 1722]